jgi:hypothetical protein
VRSGHETPAPSESIREYATGATRNRDDLELDFDGCLSPEFLLMYAAYMRRKRHQADGSIRADDNWKLGMPMNDYMKSGFRHFMDWWCEHHGAGSREGMEDALCGLFFNVQGYAHEMRKV